MEWNDIRYFLALARSGSVRAAGATLGVSHSTVARRVEALEDQMKTRLFDRHPGGFVLTDAGRQMMPGAERVEAEMASLERSLVGQDERLAGKVELTCCDNYVATFLLQELKPFCQAHPDIELCVTTDSRPFDLSKREADLAIRTLPTGVAPPEFLIGSLLAPVVVSSFVGVAHAERLDPEQEGASPKWISVDDERTQLAMAASTNYPHLQPWGGFSSLELLAAAAAEGYGLVMLPTYVGDASPRLERLQKPDLRHLADLWLLCHPDLRDNARLRAARSAIAEAFERRSDLFAGAGDGCVGDQR